jgi:hypothetical protein
MTPVEEVDVAAVRYRPQTVQAPHLAGLSLRAFIWLMESPLLGTLVTSLLKRRNNMPQMLQQTLIPERPMYYPEYPPQQGTVLPSFRRLSLSLVSIDYLFIQRIKRNTFFLKKMILLAARNRSEPEPGVVRLADEDGHPVERVREALRCLPPYDPSARWSAEEKVPFLYWTIRDFAHAYRSGITTPSAVSSHLDCLLLNTIMKCSFPPVFSRRSKKKKSS